jgi:hypothetical protein
MPGEKRQPSFDGSRSDSDAIDASAQLYSGERASAEPPSREEVARSRVAGSVPELGGSDNWDVVHIPGAQTTKSLPMDEPPLEVPRSSLFPRSARLLVVSSYRLVGFAVLTMIVLGLVAYLAQGLFYFLNDSWVAPTVVAPTDPRVLELNARFAQQSSLRDKLAADLSHVERVIALHESFQHGFRQAIAADLQERKGRLKRLKGLAFSYARARREIAPSSSAFSALRRQQIEDEQGAGLLDVDGLTKGKYQLAQIAQAKLDLAQKTVELDQRKRSLAREARALDALTSGSTKVRKGSGPRSDALSYDVLQIRTEYERSTLEIAKARDTRDALKQSIARYDDILKKIAESPYIRAAERTGTIAFVPYENLEHASVGSEIYGCRLRLLWCKPVGKVTRVIGGEVSVQHPFNNETLRGQMVEMELGERRWAEMPVLFAGGRPLLI